MNNYKEEFVRSHWEQSAKEGKAWSAVRAGWTKEECKNRIDDTISSKLNYEENDTVLDLGCGIGYTCKMVAPQVRKYIGVDYSSEMIKTASEFNNEFKNAEFVVNDGKSIPFEDNYFDVIYSEQVFQHMNENDSYLYFQEVLRTIKPDGSFILQIPQFGRPAANGVGMTKWELNKFFNETDILEGGTHYYYIKHGNKIKS